MNRTTSALALAAALALPASSFASPSQDIIDQQVEMTYHASGAVTVDGTRYQTMSDYHRSPAFRDNGRRCATDHSEIVNDGPVPDFAPSDCSFSMTSIEGDYDPTNGDEYVIPVVFHIIERSDGVTGVISDELIQSQIDIMNEDFQALAGTPGAPGNAAKVTFQLAQFDEEGNPHSGINRVVNETYFSSPEQGKQALRWNPTLFFNVYTNNARGALGYATFPMQSAGDPDDGIVLLWSSVGRDAPQGGVYNQGRTATHEIGHYFGLFHTFQDGCGTGYTAGDLVADTVAESGPEYDCIESASSCGGGNNPIHNYMDYTTDVCMDHFTPEQVNRMRCALVHYRTSLYNAFPTVEFQYDSSELTYNFTETSNDPDGTVVSWLWDFGDGTTSTEQNPSHDYAEYGLYDVKVTVTDDIGRRVSYSETVAVNIAPIANFEYSETGDLTVVFTDTSSDANGTITGWDWDFGDGNSSSEQSPTNVYLTDGPVTVSLTVTDDLGTKTTVSQEIEIGGGCGCSSTGQGGPWGTIALFGLAFLAIRRRRR